MEVTSIAEKLFFTTVRIDTISDKGEPGAGTGFIFNYKKDENNIYRFIATNKHVVDNKKQGYITFLTKDNQNDGVLALGNGIKVEIGSDIWNETWFGHPLHDVDITICSLPKIQKYIEKQYDKELFYHYISDDLIPSEDQLKELDALESITFIGYPNGLWDAKNFLPIARRGMTASPINVDFGGEPKFLIDASVFGGSSGSPVFIFDKGMHTKKDEEVYLKTRILFIGVIAQVFQRTNFDGAVAVPIPTQNNSISVPLQLEKIDIGIVFKARTVIETIEAFIAQESTL